MPKQTAPIARNLNTTAQAADQNAVEASANWGKIGGIGSAIGAGITGLQALKDWFRGN
ncbi:MAG: hypothetical protein WBG70_19320 [Spirulinaceae cyanobacterium]